jgi:uncharacterized protein YdaU (DUF1376 family)
MSSRPWMPLYIGDFLADTMHLSATETGIYIRLIMHCWQHGGRIPLDPRKLCLITHCDARTWHQYSKTVLRFFDVVDASTALHRRVSAELHRSEEISNKRKDACQQMRLQKASKTSANADTVTVTTTATKKKNRKEKLAVARPAARLLKVGIPPDFEFSDELRQTAANCGYRDSEAERVFLEFKTYYEGEGTRKENWTKVCQSWFLRQQQRDQQQRDRQPAWQRRTAHDGINTF